MVRSLRRVYLTASIGFVAGCAAASSGDQSVRRGTWASAQAAATVTDTSLTMRILASGECYGSYGEIPGSILTRSFTLPGTYTQLIGAYPGKVQYAAQFSGSTTGDHLSITITVSSLQQTFGPYVLTFGVNHIWPACMYP